MICTGCQGTIFRYEPTSNEAGWKCCDCDVPPGEPPGYCPELDASQIDVKVSNILFQLSGELGGPAFVSVSNGSEGYDVTDRVVRECRRDGMYDQAFILERLANLTNWRDSEYWKVVGDGIRAGKDPRDRCDCGELANCWPGKGPATCSECRAPF